MRDIFRMTRRQDGARACKYKIIDHGETKRLTEADASDDVAPDYIFEGPGELLLIKDEYCQIRWRRPVPDVWLKIDQLEAFPNEK